MSVKGRPGKRRVPGNPNGRQKAPPRATHPIMKTAVEHFDNSGIPGTHIAKRAGNYSPSISGWRAGRNIPRVDLLDAALRVVGYRLEIVKDEENG